MATPLCSVCGEPTHTRCSRCKAAFYCSARCQRQDWKVHKTMCTAPSSRVVSAPTTSNTADVGILPTVHLPTEVLIDNILDFLKDEHAWVDIISLMMVCRSWQRALLLRPSRDERDTELAPTLEEARTAPWATTDTFAKWEGWPPDRARPGRIVQRTTEVMQLLTMAFSTRLMTLDLSGFPLCSMDAVAHIGHCVNLTSITLPNNDDLGYEEVFMMDDAIQMLVQACPNLLRLVGVLGSVNCQGCPTIQTIYHVAAHCPQLQEFKCVPFGHNSGEWNYKNAETEESATNQAITALAQGCTALTSLHLGSDLYKYGNLGPLATHCLQLRCL